MRMYRRADFLAVAAPSPSNITLSLSLGTLLFSCHPGKLVSSSNTRRVAGKTSGSRSSACGGRSRTGIAQINGTTVSYIFTMRCSCRPVKVARSRSLLLRVATFPDAYIFMRTQRMQKRRALKQYRRCHDGSVTLLRNRRVRGNRDGTRMDDERNYNSGA